MNWASYCITLEKAQVSLSLDSGIFFALEGSSFVSEHPGLRSLPLSHLAASATLFIKYVVKG